MSSTVTGASLGPASGSPPLASVPALVLVLRCDALTAPPARHLLAGLDEVCFGRGDAPPQRTGARLVIQLPDPRISTNHGRLVRRGATWHLDDPRSKNGAVLCGAPARTGVLGDGDVLELGHSFFLYRLGAPVGEAPDLGADDLRVPAPELSTFVGELAESFARLGRIAGTDLAVSIIGETGTGKEVVARALHRVSGRAGALVALNCGAVPEQLVESELFGVRRGAFSGATADRPGLVRGADGGTLFLDEIAELRPSSQAALLRVLQEREVTSIGDTRATKVDVRFCAATHRDLREMVGRGAFRDDLYARLLGFTVELLPLRARREDLGILIRALLARRAGAGPATLTPAAARALLAYDWPHNVRELERALTSAIALAGGRAIDVGDLPGEIRRGPARPAAPAEGDDLRAQLVSLLTAHRGNVAAVARVLGKDRMQVHRWVRRFELDLEAFRA